MYGDPAYIRILSKKHVRNSFSAHMLVLWQESILVWITSHFKAPL